MLVIVVGYSCQDYGFRWEITFFSVVPNFCFYDEISQFFYFPRNLFFTVKLIDVLHTDGCSRHSSSVGSLAISHFLTQMNDKSKDWRIKVGICKNNTWEFAKKNRRQLSGGVCPVFVLAFP